MSGSLGVCGTNFGPKDATDIAPVGNFTEDRFNTFTFWSLLEVTTVEIGSGIPRGWVPAVLCSTDSGSGILPTAAWV